LGNPNPNSNVTLKKPQPHPKNRGDVILTAWCISWAPNGEQARLDTASFKQDLKEYFVCPSSQVMQCVKPYKSGVGVANVFYHPTRVFFHTSRVMSGYQDVLSSRPGKQLAVQYQSVSGTLREGHEVHPNQAANQPQVCWDGDENDFHTLGWLLACFLMFPSFLH